MEPNRRIALGQAVRELREEHGLSQEGFADRVGLHRTYVGSIERGERNVGLDNLLRIAAALGMTGADLLARAEL
jgi:transcriptional regulator with XRE-family HTH domain